jgi:hypothetical protein
MAAIPERSDSGFDGAGTGAPAVDGARAVDGAPAVNGAPVAERAPAEVLHDLDPDDAFGHPAIADPARDDAVWSDGDEDDVDV